MRLRLRHKLDYAFGEPTRHITRVLRLTPRSFEGQHVVNWQIDVDVDCVLKAGEDGFGNIIHTFTAKGPCERLGITVLGEIENFDTAGVVRGSVERMPLDLYARETPLTAADGPLRAFAQEATAERDNMLGKQHALMEAVHKAIVFDEAAPDAASAAATFAEKKGSGCDMAHLFAACARQLGCAARVVSGYYLCEDKGHGIRHAWAEVFLPGLGWTGFDPAHDICPQERHVRLAAALDFLGAAPVRGVTFETVEEHLDLSARFGPAWSQTQSQGPGWQRQRQGGQSQSQG